VVRCRVMFVRLETVSGKSSAASADKSGDGSRISFFNSVRFYQKRKRAKCPLSISIESI